MLEEMAICVLPTPPPFFFLFWKTVSEFWKRIWKEVNVDVA